MMWRVKESLSSMCDIFDNLCILNVENLYQIQVYFEVS